MNNYYQYYPAIQGYEHDIRSLLLKGIEDIRDRIKCENSINDNTIVNNMTIPVHGVIKYFNPPLGKLLWMDVEFLNYDGTLFDFRGQENLLVFTINLLNQPGKYNNYVNSN